MTLPDVSSSCVVDAAVAVPLYVELRVVANVMDALEPVYLLCRR